MFCFYEINHFFPSQIKNLFPFFLDQKGCETNAANSYGSLINPSDYTLFAFFTLQLSHYLDTTEVKLAQQIASRSDDFFRTMSSQEQLQGDVSNTCTDIRHLR